MKKEFIFKEEGTLYLTKEQMIEKFNNAINEFASKCTRAFAPESSRTYNNVYEYEDYLQFGFMELVNCYYKYDIEKGLCFSTYLFTALANKKVCIAREISSQKRRLEIPVVSLSQSGKYDDTVESTLFGKEDTYFKEARGFDDFLKTHLTAEEQTFLAMGIQKTKNKSNKKTQKQCVDYSVEVFNEDSTTDTRTLTKAELAVELGISRPTLNKRIKETIDKATNLAEEYKAANYD
ncbi:hypothetical protein UT300003_32980 [Clostridium sardiniense]